MKDRIAVLTRRAVILGVRKRWNDQYSHHSPEDKIGRPPEPIKDIKARLRKLDLKTCSVADVDKAIGTDGWAANECDCCGSDVEATVGFQSQYSDDRWMQVCPDCLAKASASLAVSSKKLGSEK